MKNAALSFTDHVFGLQQLPCPGENPSFRKRLHKGAGGERCGINFSPETAAKAVSVNTKTTLTPAEDILITSKLRPKVNSKERI